MEAQHLVRGILADPGQWKKHFRRTTASVMKSIIYDSRSVELEDTIVTYISNMVVRLARAWVPGAHLVEFMPFLKAVPSR